VTADEVVALLGLEPHPEGGCYAETWQDASGRGSAIYYLLRASEHGAWHRIDAAETWHWYAGAPLELRVSPDGTRVETLVLGSDLGAGERPQLRVEPQVWQSARSLGPWTLCGCTVVPAFR